MDIALVPVPARAFAWLFGLAFGPPVLTMIVLRLFNPGLSTSVLAIVAAVVLVVGGIIGWAMGRHRMHVASGHLILQASRLYRLEKPLADVDWSKARAGDLAHMTDVRTTLRTNGIGLPGYSAGWFRLANGSKAMLMLTDASRVIVLPFADGETLIASVEDPESALEQLRAASH